MIVLVLFNTSLLNQGFCQKLDELCGYTPVIILDRDGPHIGSFEYALVKDTPESANFLMFGEIICGCPFRSSL